MTSFVVDDSMRILERRRLSFLFADVHILHVQAIIGTPLLVPVPKNVIFKEG